MIQRSGDWLTARVGAEIMMMSAAKGNYLGINEVGARIWDLIDPPIELATLCDRLTREFEISIDQCRIEVGAFLADMEKHGAIAIDPA